MATLPGSVILLSLVTGNRNSEGAQKMEVLGGECAFFLRLGILVSRLRHLKGRVRLFLHLVQPNGRFQHEHHFEALAANIGNDAGNLWRLRDAFMDRFAQLLNQFAEFLIQFKPRFPGIAAGSSDRPFSYLIF